jgi:RimJ/RimL family protein N-acetyltransferase
MRSLNETRPASLSLKGILLREANPGDIDTLVELGADVFAEHPTLPHGYDPDKARMYLLWIMGRNEAVNIVAEKDGEIVSALFGVLLPDMFSVNVLAQEAFFGIVPQHRSFELAREMIRAFTQTCFACGATAVQFSPSTHEKWSRYRRFLARMGFEEVHVAMRFKRILETN